MRKSLYTALAALTYLAVPLLGSSSASAATVPNEATATMATQSVDMSKPAQLKGKLLTCSNAYCFSAMPATNPKTNNEAFGGVNFNQTFNSVSGLCVTLRFGGDLLDPGDEVDLSLGSVESTVGVGNPTTSPQASRESCWPAGPSSDAAFAALLDGQENFTLWAFTGHARVTGVSFTLVK